MNRVLLSKSSYHLYVLLIYLATGPLQAQLELPWEKEKTEETKGTDKKQDPAKPKGEPTEGEKPAKNPDPIPEPPPTIENETPAQDPAIGDAPREETPTATDKQRNPGRLPAWKDLSGRRLAAMELSQVDAATLRLLRNEIYARHGRIFKNAELKAHFEKQPWYRPTRDEVEDSELSEVEVANVRTIERAEQTAKSSGGAIPGSPGNGGADASDVLSLPEAIAFGKLLKKKRGAEIELQALEEELPNPVQEKNYGFRFTGYNIGYDDDQTARFMVWERFAIHSKSGKILHYDVVNDTYESLETWRKRSRE